MSPFPRQAWGSLVPYAPDRRPVAVDLSDNTNRWGTHPAALAALRGAPPEDLVRYPPVYADGLREAVARRFDVPPETVSTGCGSDDLLDSAFRAAGEPGEAVAFLPPTFSMVEVFARMNGMTPLAVNRDPPRRGEPFGPLPDPARLLGAGGLPGAGRLPAASRPGAAAPPPTSALHGAGRPALIYVCRPNNPTGEVLPGGWIRSLMEQGGPDGPILLVDEAYVDFLGEGGAVPEKDDRKTGHPETSSGEDAQALLREAASSSRTVVLRTLSKAYGLAGLRIGFAVGAPEVIREIEKSRGPYKVSRPAERAGVTALEDREGWVPEVVARVREGRTRLRRALEERGLAPLPSGANFLLVPLGGADRTEDEGAVGSAATVTAALRGFGVAVRPFPALPGLGDAIRVTIGPPGEMDRFVEALDRVLEP